MKKNLLIKTLAVGIIFLFIGVAVAPSTAVDIPNKEDVIEENNSINDCDCQPVDEINLVRIERALDRVESYTRILSLFSKRYPETGKEFKELNIDTSSDDYSFPIICSIWESLVLSLSVPFVILHNILWKLPENSPLWNIINFILGEYEVLMSALLLSGILLGCWELPIP